MRKEEVIRTWFTEIWERENLAMVDRLLSPSLSEDKELDGLCTPRSELPELVSVIRRLTGPLTVEILQTIEQGESLCAEYLVRAQGATGDKSIEAGGMVVARFEEGRIADLRTQFDCFTLFEQLGQLPEDALVACLSGQKLTWQN